MAWDMDPGGKSPQTAIFTMFHDDQGSSDTVDLNSEALGTIVYLQQGFQHASSTLVEAGNANFARIKDLVAIAEPGGVWGQLPRPITTRLTIQTQNLTSVFNGTIAHDVFVDNVISLGGLPNLIDWPTATGGTPPVGGATLGLVAGSLNQDGKRTLADVRLLILMPLGQVPQDLTRADLTRDGRLSLADVQALIRLLVTGESTSILMRTQD